MKKVFLTAAIAVAVCMSSVAQAAIYFSQAQLLNMTIDLGNSIGYNAGNGTGILTGNPPGVYEDGVTPMSGQAGAIGNLNNVQFPGATAYYALNQNDLNTFNAAISGGGETLSAVGFNDNNQSWLLGIWYETAAGIVDAFTSPLAPGASGGVSLALPNSVLAAGVAVRSNLTQPDDYHASWGVPEPTSILVWGALGIVSLAAGRRSRDDR